MEELISKKKELKEMLEYIDRYILEKANMIGSTIIRSHLGTLFNINFDTVIIDECSQISIPLGLMGLIKGKKWVVIGDHLQLLPIFKNIKSNKIELHAKLSFFSYLINKFGWDAYLSVHYRSLPDIIAFSKENVYKERNIIIKVSKNSGRVCREYERLLSSVDYLRHPVVFIHIAGTCKKEKGSGSVYNEEEVEICREIIQTLKSLGIKYDKIGIIAPYVAQVKKLQEIFKDKNNIGDIGYIVNTVDSFQGKEKDIIIYSITGTDRNRINFASHPNRLNVALTRVKCRLIIVGNANAIKRTKTKLNEFLRWIVNKGYLFDWESRRWIEESLA
ncbi:MAG: hypothetical protein DRP01_05420 [Archaeoglobales archaeon]|nr:MAG: hypothetical protein DRP01_05420 [Archaeoglobales archaeon]